MNVLKELISAGGNELIRGVGEIVNRQSEAHLGKKELALEIEKLISKRLHQIGELATREIESREKVMLSELGQDDRLTKRMRPLLAGSGVVMAFLEGCFKLSLFLTGTITIGDLGVTTDPLLIPAIYWQGWIAVASVWGVSRGIEKVKATGRIGEVAQWVTGSRKHKSILASRED